MIDRFEEFTTVISCIYKNIQKLKRDEMALFGLKGPHVQCLVALHQRPEGATITQLCELCELDKAAISRAVAELEAKGVIEARQAGGRFYRAPLCLTEQGAQIADQISAIIDQMVAAAGEGLSGEDRRVFYATLNKISSNLQRLVQDGAASDPIQGENHHAE